MAIGVQITFDCADPARLTEFWTAALGYKMSDPPEGFDTWQAWAAAAGIPEENWNDMSDAVDPAGVGPRLLFQKVPEPKITKNRVHLDVNVGAGLRGAERRAVVDEAAQRLEGLGASRVEVMELREEYWIIMRDPEGNEFCLQ